MKICLNNTKDYIHIRIIILMLLSHNKRGMELSRNILCHKKNKAHTTLYIVIDTLYIN